MSTGPSSPGILTILPHYKQEDPERYCGPASAQMVLDGCFGVKRAQTDLWNATQKDCASGEWYSAPPCLCRASNDSVAAEDPFILSEQSCGVLNCCEAATLSSGCESSRAVVLDAALAAVYSGGAALAAVKCNQHWVALCGYETSGGPTIAEVSKVYLHDPAPVANAGAIDCAKDEWLTNYFNGGRGLPGWYVAIAGTGDGPLSPTTIEDEGDPDVDSLPDDLTRPAIAAFALARASRSLLNRHHPLWVNSVDQVAGEPFDVTRLDTAKGYVLIPIRDAKGTVRVLGQVDAGNGKYMSTLFSKDSAVLPKAEADVLALVARRKAPAPDLTSLSVERTLVWKPCRESPSPFLPFHRVRTREGNVYYVRLDGPVFAQLTEPLKSGG